MIVIFCDTETTGKETSNSAAFEIAFLVYQDGFLVGEKVFHLNPLSETIKFSEEAYRINGVSEETIKSYTPALEVIHEIAKFLDPFVNETTSKEERLVFAGYCVSFDFNHLKALIERYGYNMDYFFSGRMIDVYELVKKAKAMGLIGKTKDNKLETMTKALGIPHDAVHSALGDIRATRKLYEAIYAIGRREQ
jgi:DNA polymerase III epsilon subunit-like protein